MRRTRAETSAVNGFLRFLSLQANIQLEVVNVIVEALCRLCDLFIGVPIQEARIFCKKNLRFEGELPKETLCAYV